MFRVAVLDDYQQVALKMANWKILEPEGEVQAFADKFGAVPYTDFRRMLATARLDLLIVALPPGAHNGEVEQAAQAGLHLLVEKPIALSMERAESMVQQLYGKIKKISYYPVSRYQQAFEEPCTPE